ncbi:poly(ethylene terephthalate) hydrolase family protein [Actinokineospora bangkokensis]|uniref:PET hydrolase/cutinase-like domain-containing protein n=1 Tax=Actinokineospora bangkokensis TaxID=1193682 RepID=A0A1Q9LLV5_9PSEU|nr:hypothetical protein [Actinokineospora bangkokensis]OLR92984.1 hypothetical protein BJP25_18650 [Actinokineospora bangkokensis]
MRGKRKGVLGVALVVAGLAVAPSAHAAAAPSVESAFSAPGPAGVTQRRVTSGAGLSYTLFLPADLTTDGFRNPVITWGNGSETSCATYSGLLGHLASWGFAVVCADSNQVGYGFELWEGALTMIAANANPADPLHDQLDTDHIGAAGHSQGATGALNATVLGEGTITSTLALAFVDPFWHKPQDQLPDLTRVTTPVLLLSGKSDPLTSQQAAYLKQLRVPAAKAARVGADHEHVPATATGYATAWFLHTLRGDPRAAAAFTGPTPEIARNPDWTDWSSTLG